MPINSISVPLEKIVILFFIRAFKSLTFTATTAHGRNNFMVVYIVRLPMCTNMGPALWALHSQHRRLKKVRNLILRIIVSKVLRTGDTDLYDDEVPEHSI